MTVFDFDTPIDRTATGSIKWDRYRGRDVLPLWLADMDFPSPPAVIEAIRERADHGIFGYSGPPDELVDRVRHHLEKAYHWPVKAEWLVWLPGLVTGINAACRTAGRPGEGILTTTPVYPPFLSAPELGARRLQTSPLIRHGQRWEMDFDHLEAAIRPDTAMFLLCSPHNPTGRLYDAGELETLAAICQRHDLLICSDEIHCDLVLEQGRGHLPMAALAPKIAARTITLMAPSKTWNIPGLGCSFAVIPDRALRQRFCRTCRGIVPDVNLMGFTAALAAYRDGAEWLDAALTYLRGNGQRVMACIERLPGLRTTPVEATYLAWIDARELPVDNPHRFFENAGVGLSDGAEFAGEGFVRLNFACPRNCLDKALARITTAVQSLASHGEKPPC